MKSYKCDMRRLTHSHSPSTAAVIPLNRLPLTINNLYSVSALSQWSSQQTTWFMLCTTYITCSVCSVGGKLGYPTFLPYTREWIPLSQSYSKMELKKKEQLEALSVCFNLYWKHQEGCRSWIYSRSCKLLLVLAVPEHCRFWQTQIFKKCF